MFISRERSRLLAAAALSFWISLTPALADNMQPAPQGRQVQRLEDVLRYAYQYNPTLRAARDELAGTHELVPQAQAGWKPTANASGNITKAWIDGDELGGDGSVSKEITLNANEAIYRGGRTVAATPGAGVGWAPGAVGVVALVAVSAAVVALLLRVGGNDR